MVKTDTYAKKTEGGAIPLTICAGEGSELPSLVVVPSIFGVTDDVVAQMQELAERAVIVALDPFWRVEAGPISYADPQRALARMQQLDLQACFRDVVTTLRWTANHPRTHGRVAMLGICFGGPFALLAAADGLLAGVATWHGSRMQHFLDRAADMTCPMVHHVGGNDAVVPREALEQIESAFAGRADVQVVVHEGAAHGFTHRGNQHHDPVAERAAMQDVAALLEHL
ncbi:MAG: dienelactone hydrolase family protein [Deltaproteobacteria bacterium]|jgi:carboxymethylenebutenolidase